MNYYFDKMLQSYTNDLIGGIERGTFDGVLNKIQEAIIARKEELEPRPLPIHRTEAGYPNCSTCDGGGCYDCTDPA